MTTTILEQCYLDENDQGEMILSGLPLKYKLSNKKSSYFKSRQRIWTSKIVNLTDDLVQTTRNRYVTISWLNDEPPSKTLKLNGWKKVLYDTTNIN